MLFAALLSMGSALMLLARVVEFLAADRNCIAIAGVIRKRLPTLSGSLLSTELITG
jgi:hypothetical protein